jgi:hypothetical protein
MAWDEVQYPYCDDRCLEMIVCLLLMWSSSSSIRWFQCYSVVVVVCQDAVQEV